MCRLNFNKTGGFKMIKHKFLNPIFFAKVSFYLVKPSSFNYSPNPSLPVSRTYFQFPSLSFFHMET
jgi:hypothetical protein